MFHPRLFVFAIYRGIQKIVARTPLYIAPEISRGNPHDIKVDVYSFSSFMNALVTENKKIHTIQNFRRIVNDGIGPTFGVPFKKSILYLI